MLIVDAVDAEDEVGVRPSRSRRQSVDLALGRCSGARSRHLLPVELGCLSHAPIALDTGGRQRFGSRASCGSGVVGDVALDELEVLGAVCRGVFPPEGGEERGEDAGAGAELEDVG